MKDNIAWLASEPTDRTKHLTGANHMTDIDIERLQESAKMHAHCEPDCCDDSNCPWCAMLALIERLKQVEEARDNLVDRLTCMCGDDMDRHPHGDGHSPTSMYDHYRLEWDDMKQKLSDAEAQRDRLQEILEIILRGNHAENCAEVLFSDLACDCHIEIAKSVLEQENRIDE